MNRRKFLTRLGVGTAAVVVAPAAIMSCGDPWCGSIAGEGIVPHDELHNTVFGEGSVIQAYADYESFSAFALAASIDPIVENAARELAKAHGERINRLVSHVGD